MKLIIYTIFFFIMGTPAHASEAHDSCKVISEMSYSMMLARQHGTSLSDSMEILERADGLPEGVRKLSENILIAAYKMDQHASKELKEKVSREFENAIYINCYTKLNEK